MVKIQKHKNITFFFKNQITLLNVHWGHSKNQWNRQINSYILGLRNLSCVFDIMKIMFLLRSALFFIRSFSIHCNTALLLENKHIFSNYVIEKVYKNPNYVYIKDYWIKGLLTNFRYIAHNKLRFYHLHNEAWQDRMQGFYFYPTLPKIVFSFNNNLNYEALIEANTIGLTSIGIIDSDSYFLNFTYPLLGNDDSYESVCFYLELIFKTIVFSNHEKKIRFHDEAIQLRIKKPNKVWPKNFMKKKIESSFKIKNISKLFQQDPIKIKNLTINYRRNLARTKSLKKFKKYKSKHYRNILLNFAITQKN